MAIVSYEQFLPYVQPYVPECPIVIMQDYLAEAASYFCKETYIWRVDIEEDVTSAGEYIYDMSVPASTALEDILHFEVNGSLISRLFDGHVPPLVSDKLGIPLAYSIYLDTQVKLYPTPDDTYTFRGIAVVKPTLSASGIEGFIYETYGRAIACGAIALLAAIPDKAWSNPGIAMDCKRKFDVAIADARMRDTRTVPMRVQAQNFA